MMRIKILLLCIIFNIFSIAFAADKNIGTEEQCFIDLVENIEKIPLWKTGYKEVLNLKYADLEPSFSQNYKNMSSFGVDIDEPLFEMRVYSFGKQTGYIHPPYSPFENYKKTEKWNTPSKEFIIAEEYITIPNGDKQFLGCSFMQLDSEKLMNVTSENYLYDGELISVVQKEQDGYKAWYNENVSYDHSDNPFVTWKRLFIFPKETQNDYFSKYDVLDSFPSNSIDDLGSLIKTDNEGKPFGFKDDGMVNTASRIYLMDSDGIVTNYLGDKNLAPIVRTGFDKIFPLNSYYQSIENAFPDFGEKLSIRGSLHYDVVKEILATGENENFAHVWSTVLDTKEITKYALHKENNTLVKYDSNGLEQLPFDLDTNIVKEDDFYEEQLSRLDIIEDDVKKLLVEYKEDVKKETEQFMTEENIPFDKDEKIVQDINGAENTLVSDDEIKSGGNKIYIIILFIIIILAGVSFFLFKRKK